MDSRLYNLRIQQLWRWQEQWFGIATSIPVALWLMPHAVCMQQRLPILGSLIAGKERNMRIGDVKDTLEKQIGALLRPFTEHEGHHEPPHGGKGDPHPRIAIGLIVEPSKRHMVVLGMHKAPEFVELAFDDMEVAPQVKQHQAAVLGRSIQPCTYSIFVNRSIR